MYRATKNSRWICLWCCVGLVWTTGGAATPPPTESAIDPLALEQINRMRSAMESIGPYRITLETLEDEALASGQLVQASQTAVIQVSRPDQLSIVVKRDTGERWAAWLSGAQGVLFDAGEERYARLELTPPVDQALDELSDRYALELPLIDVISGLRRTGLLERVKTGLYLGTETVAGKECHHLLFRQPETDWQMWIETADPALPRKLLLVFKDKPHSPIYQTTIQQWDLSADFKDSDWEPKLPKHAREVGIDELLGQEESP